jgi:hypothetical protein
MPGAVFNPTAGSRRVSSSTKDSGGEPVRGSSSRLPEVSRRAGSQNAPPTPDRSVFVASSQRSTASGQCRRFIVATAAVSSSRSTASTSCSSPARAIASAPIPQPRSATRCTPAAENRWACRAATGSLVACSSPCGVNSMPAANGPNFPRAWARSRVWVNAAATSSGG